MESCATRPIPTVVMFLRYLTIIGLAILSASATGCRCASTGRLPCIPTAPCAYEQAVAEETPPDLFEMVPEHRDDDGGLAVLPAPGETYQLLDAATCQCNAATNANLANLVELERHWAQIIIECDTRNVRKNLCLERDLLALHATDARNKAAGSALEAFYQLASLEARSRYLAKALEETRRSLQRAEKLHEKGLPLEIDRSEISASLSQLEDRGLQLDYLRIQLNGQLQKMLNCPLSEQAFFWPSIDWLPDLAPVDADVQVAAGLGNRSDIRGLQLTICRLEKTTLPVARGVVGVADGTLGSVEKVDGLIHSLRCFRCTEGEVPIRRRQLALLLTDTEQLATAEIKASVHEITLQQQRVVLARKVVEQRRQRLHELIAKRDAEDVSIFEISKGRARWYEAESELIQQVAQLKIARVRLRKAQGMLATECDFAP